MSGFSSCKNQKLFQELFSLTQDRNHEENSNAIWRCFIRCYPNSTQNVAHEMEYSGWFLKDGRRKGRSMQAHSQHQQVLSILWFQKWVGIDTSILSPENWIPLCLVWKDNGGALYTTSTRSYILLVRFKWITHTPSTRFYVILVRFKCITHSGL